MPLAYCPFEGMDIRSLIDEQAARRTDLPFLIWEPFEGEGRTWTYGAFAQTLRRFAAGLHARGVRSGDRVLVHLENCPEAVISWLGCAYAGAVAVTTNAKSTKDELAYFARHSAAVGGITQPKFNRLLAEAAPQLPWRVMTETDNGAPAEHSAAEPFEPFSSIDGDPASLPARPHDPWAHFGIQFSSGTTSRPKAVLLTHGNALWGARLSAEHEDLRSDDVYLTHLPLFHINAQVYSVLASLWVGARVVLIPRFSASRFWPISLKHGATWTSVVPFCVRALMEHPKPERHSYRYWGNGYCEPPSDEYFGIKTIGWWGMTETVTHGTIGSAHRKDASNSMGRPAAGYDIYVLDAAGNPVQPGEVGDLYVGGRRGLSLFLEYFGDPEATAAAFRADGLFITGDRVKVGKDGFLYFADRAKDMLKVGGENVAASEIEQAILMVPGVVEVAVVAKKHPMLDEVPVAFVLAASDRSTELVDQIAAHCARQLAAFKQPHQIRIVEKLPRSTLEKIAKAELRALLALEANTASSA
jgi:carnitine-CoA ligase